MANNKRLIAICGGVLAVVVLGFASISHFHRIGALFKKDDLPKRVSQQISQDEANEAFQMLIQGKLAEVQECYNAQLKNGLDRQGKLVVLWAVDAQGKSSDFTEELNELGSGELYDCTISAIQSWAFPKNKPTYIRYTFKMRALEKDQPNREVSNTDEL